MIEKPFNWDQVIALNKYQRSGWHPYTCGNDRRDRAHTEYQAAYGGDFGELIATPNGWECPVCHYTQDWAGPELFEIVKMPKSPFMEAMTKASGIRPMLTQYAIYHKTNDYGDKYVVRPWYAFQGIIMAIPGECQLADTLEEARELIPRPLQQLKPFPEDDPTIVETYL